LNSDSHILLAPSEVCAALEEDFAKSGSVPSKKEYELIVMSADDEGAGVAKKYPNIVKLIEAQF